MMVWTLQLSEPMASPERGTAMTWRSWELFHGHADFVNVLRGIREALKERQPASQWADRMKPSTTVQVIRPLADSP